MGTGVQHKSVTSRRTPCLFLNVDFLCSVQLSVHLPETPLQPLGCTLPHEHITLEMPVAAEVNALFDAEYLGL